MRLYPHIRHKLRTVKGIALRAWRSRAQWCPSFQLLYQRDAGLLLPISTRRKPFRSNMAHYVGSANLKAHRSDPQQRVKMPADDGSSSNSRVGFRPKYTYIQPPSQALVLYLGKQREPPKRSIMRAAPAVPAPPSRPRTPIPSTAKPTERLVGMGLFHSGTSVAGRR